MMFQGLRKVILRKATLDQAAEKVIELKSQNKESIQEYRLVRNRGKGEGKFTLKARNISDKRAEKARLYFGYGDRALNRELADRVLQKAEERVLEGRPAPLSGETKEAARKSVRDSLLNASSGIGESLNRDRPLTDRVVQKLFDLVDAQSDTRVSIHRLSEMAMGSIGEELDLNKSPFTDFAETIISNVERDDVLDNRSYTIVRNDDDTIKSCKLAVNEVSGKDRKKTKDGNRGLATEVLSQLVDRVVDRYKENGSALNHEDIEALKTKVSDEILKSSNGLKDTIINGKALRTGVVLNAKKFADSYPVLSESLAKVTNATGSSAEEVTTLPASVGGIQHSSNPQCADNRRLSTQDPENNADAVTIRHSDTASAENQSVPESSRLAKMIDQNLNQLENTEWEENDSDTSTSAENSQKDTKVSNLWGAENVGPVSIDNFPNLPENEELQVVSELAESILDDMEQRAKKQEATDMAEDLVSEMVDSATKSSADVTQTSSHDQTEATKETTTQAPIDGSSTPEAGLMTVDFGNRPVEPDVMVLERRRSSSDGENNQVSPPEIPDISAGIPELSPVDMHSETPDAKPDTTLDTVPPAVGTDEITPVNRPQPTQETQTATVDATIDVTVDTSDPTATLPVISETSLQKVAPYIMGIIMQRIVEYQKENPDAEPLTEKNVLDLFDDNELQNRYIQLLQRVENYSPTDTETGVNWDVLTSTLAMPERGMVKLNKFLYGNFGKKTLNPQAIAWGNNRNISVVPLLAYAGIQMGLAMQEVAIGNTDVFEAKDALRPLNPFLSSGFMVVSFLDAAVDIQAVAAALKARSAAKATIKEERLKETFIEGMHATDGLELAKKLSGDDNLAEVSSERVQVIKDSIVKLFRTTSDDSMSDLRKAILPVIEQISPDMATKLTRLAGGEDVTFSDDEFNQLIDGMKDAYTEMKSAVALKLDSAERKASTQWQTVAVSALGLARAAPAFGAHATVVSAAFNIGSAGAIVSAGQALPIALVVSGAFQMVYRVGQIAKLAPVIGRQEGLKNEAKRLIQSLEKPETNPQLSRRAKKQMVAVLNQVANIQPTAASKAALSAQTEMFVFGGFTVASSATVLALGAATAVTVALGATGVGLAGVAGTTGIAAAVYGSVKDRDKRDNSADAILGLQELPMKSEYAREIAITRALQANPAAAARFLVDGLHSDNEDFASLTENVLQKLLAKSLSPKILGFTNLSKSSDKHNQLSPEKAKAVQDTIADIKKAAPSVAAPYVAELLGLK